MRDYIAKIPKKDLIHGAYYKGTCRNATVARWNAEKEVFVHWRNKFGWFLETICHPEDEDYFDVFVVDTQITEEEALQDNGEINFTNVFYPNRKGDKVVPD